MADKGDKGDWQRSQQILTELLRTGTVTVNELALRMGVTPTTIRRDLSDLERHGLLRRVHGGAIPVETPLYEPFRHNVSFHEQEVTHAEEKRRIGLAAAELIADGETIALTGGTTSTQVARSIRHRKNITILTNSVNIPMELSQRDDLTVIVTGGILRGSWFSLVGPAGIHTIGDMFTDKVFIGVDGIHPEFGLTSHYPDEAAMNRAMIAHARQKIVVAFHDKIGKITRALICGLREIDMLITDTDADDDSIAPLLEQGIDVKRV